MSTLETRIAEVLAASDSAHQFKKAEQMNTDYPHFWCSCGVQTIGRGKFPEHVRQASTAALATVITSSNAAAWHEGYRDGQRQDAEGDDGPQFTNPYRADKLATE